MAPTVLVLVTLPSSMRHRSLRGSPEDEEAVVFGVAEGSSCSISLPPRIRFVDLSKSRKDLILFHLRDPFDTCDPMAYTSSAVRVRLLASLLMNNNWGGSWLSGSGESESALCFSFFIHIYRFCCYEINVVDNSNSFYLAQQIPQGRSILDRQPPDISRTCYPGLL